MSGEGSVPFCHQLHYLQMACEKIAKAYRFRDTATREDKLTSSHVALTSFIESLLSSTLVKKDYKGRDAQLTQVRKDIRNIAREIEKLAPAVDKEQSPSNAEYPWESGKHIVIPCQYSYPNLSSLRDENGRHFLKLIKEAILKFDKRTIR